MDWNMANATALAPNPSSQTDTVANGLAGAPPVVETRGLRKAYGTVVALDRMDLTIPRAAVGLLGPNGAGKTTLFELVSGNLRPDAGGIRFRDVDLVGRPPHAIARLGLVRTFQTSRVFANLTVLENVLVGAHGRIRYGLLGALLRPPAVARAEAAARASAFAALELFGGRLVPRADDFVITLSFANRRRTEIARALAAAPTLLLLDEPAAGMNPSEKREIAGHIRDIRARGHTVLLIEHHMQTVMDISDRVVVLDHGEKIAEGPPAVIREDARVVEAYLGRGAALRRPRRPDA
jgi:branched-chain amino acid transport system ATP-binding protein